MAGKTRTVPSDAPILAAALAVGTSFGVKDFEKQIAHSSAYGPFS